MVGPVAPWAQSIDVAEVRAEEDFRWGVRAFHNGFYGDSILSLEKSLGLKPERVLTRLWLGNALYRAGYVDAALREWRFVLEREPGNAELKSRVQIVEYRRGLGTELEPPSPFVVDHQIGGGESGAYPLGRPTATHVRPDGSFFVVSFAAGEVIHMNVNSRVLGVLKGSLKGFNRPFDCLEVPDPETGEPTLYITEYGGNRIVRTRLDGQELARFGSPGRGPGQLLGPQYLAADERGYIYVSDWGNRRISKFDLAGNFILAMGEPRTLENPSGLAVVGGRVWVVDHGRGRIVVFDESGNHLYSFGEQRLSSPEGIAVLDEDTLLVSDQNRVLEYNIPDETWELVSDLSSQAGNITHLAISSNGEVYATDFDGNQIIVLSEMRELYSNLAVDIERIDSSRFPEITVEVSAESRQGVPLVGLEDRNFVLTEGYRPVADPRLIRANTDAAPVDVVLVVEKSIPMKGFQRELDATAETLVQQFGKGGGVEVLSADRRARVDAPFGSSRLDVLESLRRPDWTPEWRFDLGVRMAASELIPRARHKAVVYAASGSLPADAFAEYSLAEVGDYLRNNEIPLFVVHYDVDLAPELRFLCELSGGAACFYYAPSGLGPLVGALSRQLSSRYVLRYTSRSDDRFGLQYIELRAEVILNRRSGRAASGYYAPLRD
jgi:DNA-binding beta-propeller fold protein YncE